MDRFPGLYSIECRKYCKVAARINTHGFEWNWSCDVSNVGLSQELDQLRAVDGLFVPGERVMVGSVSLIPLGFSLPNHSGPI